MGIFLCPVCRGRLERLCDKKGKFSNTYKCKKGHSYDLSASGYLHLLPASQMNSKIPGDNKQMVMARRNFLANGYYKSISDAVNSAVVACCVKKKQDKLLHIADVGCGEGYYTSSLADALFKSGIYNQTIGLDISKYAVDYAARAIPKDSALSCLREDGEVGLKYGVASLFDLPIKDHSCVAIINMFAPVCIEEFHRVLKRGGILVFAVSSTRHLWGLKEKIYDTPYENEKFDHVYDGFTMLSKQKIHETIFLDNQQDIDSLFMMTPYYYKSSVETSERVHNLGTLETEIDVDIITYSVK